jgi:hypothetical protein
MHPVALIAALLLCLLVLAGSQTSGSGSGAQQVCKVEEMSKGRWVYRNDSTLQKSFRCCSGEYNDYQDSSLVGFCSANESLLVSGRACYCDEMMHTRHLVTEREKYFWQTDNCLTLDWNATRFCDLLGTRTILLIGDSTNRQTASTLRSMVQGYEPKGVCAMQIVSRDSDFLVPFDTIKPRPSLPERSGPWMRHIRELSPDIVVLSTGAHYMEVDAYVSMLGTLSSMINKIRRTFQHPPKFVWKTQNPAHHGCHTGATEKPLGNISDLVVYDDKNKWIHHRTYDSLARNMSALLDIHVIDMSPLYLRQDGHVGYLAWDLKGGDCLHYCLPGALNIFSVMMVHLLLSLDASGNDDDYSARRRRR